jgi:hypothetical protein
VKKLLLTLPLAVAGLCTSAAPAKETALVDAKTKCGILEPDDPDLKFLSFGAPNCVNGLAEGWGVIALSGRHGTERGAGNWHGGRLHDAEADYEWSAVHARYHGSMIGGVIEGAGAMDWSDGSHYSGQWVNGKMHGEGKYAFGNGDSYTGQFVSGVARGWGTYVWKASGVNYSGNWLDGRAHGIGTLSDSKRTIYHGQWNNGCSANSESVVAMTPPVEPCSSLARATARPQPTQVQQPAPPAAPAASPVVQPPPPAAQPAPPATQAAPPTAQVDPGPPPPPSQHPPPPKKRKGVF